MRLIALLLAWAGLTALGLSRLSFNVDVLELLPTGSAEFDGIRDLYRHFGRERELILTLSAPEAETAKAGAASLAKRLAEKPGLARSAVWRLPFEEQPELAGELLAWLWLNGPPEALDSLAQSLAPDRLSATLDDVLEDLASGFLDESILLRSYDPLGFTNLPGGLRESVGADADLFASPDGTFRVIYLEAPVDSFPGYRETAAWIEAVRAEIADWQKGQATPVAVGLTGEPAFVAEISLAMQRDMTGSVIATTLLIAALFWIWHRRLVPLLWLVMMLGLIFSATFAMGGVLFGELTAMSIGFAAILLGLAVDYGIVLYRESGSAGNDVSALRKGVGPGIAWAAATTAAVFASLNLSSLPGITELGTLVAIGTVTGAAVMLVLFAPVAARFALPEGPPAPEPSGSGKAALAVTGTILVAGFATWAIAGPPGLNRNARPFELRDGKSMAALEEMSRRLDTESDSALPHLPVVVTADDPVALADRLAETAARLESARADGLIRSFQLPGALAPDPRRQRANLATVSRLAAERDRLIGETLDHGFSDEATALTERLLDAWKNLGGQLLFKEAGESVMPSSALARWLLGRAVSVPASGKAGDSAAVGRLLPVSLDPGADGHLTWAARINGPGIRVTGWDIVNPVLQSLVADDFRRVFLPMGLILAAMLAVVFRDWRDTLLAIGALGFSGLALMTLTRWLPIEWNTFNASSLPILFGTGMDYAIHMIFALRRARGNLAPIRAGISKALLFCGVSTAIGFGSLAFASSEGLSSLGLVCALGILLNMVTAVWLLPWWWRRCHAGRS